MTAYGESLREGWGTFDHIVNLFRYENGMSGVFSYSSYLPSHGNHFTIQGTEGTLQVLPDKILFVNSVGEKRELHVEKADPHRQMWLSIARGEKAPFSFSDAMNVQRVYDWMEQSVNRTARAKE